MRVRIPRLEIVTEAITIHTRMKHYTEECFHLLLVEKEARVRACVAVWTQARGIRVQRYI